MSRLRPVPLLLMALPLLLSPACKRGHSLDGAQEGPQAASEGLPARSVTRWTEKTELFMEYEPPVLGREGKFAAHLTALPSFKALTEGVMTLTMKMADGTTLTSQAETPSSPGIFRVLIRPSKPGKCSLSISVQSPQATDEIDAGPCDVFTDVQAALAAEEKESRGGITFTKEQQWKTEFATTVVGDRELQPAVRANAEIRPVAGKEAKLTATATGRVTLSSPVPIVGMSIEAGQVLAVIFPRLSAGGDRASLEAEVQSARVDLEAAESQRARAERLFKEQAVPQRNMEEARARFDIARARLGAASGRLEQYNAGAAGVTGARENSFYVRSPIEGTLVSASVASGESVEEGKLLFTVIDMKRLWLDARVFEPDIPRVEGARSAWFTVEGYEQPFVIDEKNGKLVTIGRVIDPQSRTVPVVFEFANPDAKLRIGQFAKADIATGGPVRVLALPESSLIDEGGKPVTYVQLEGETFQRRALTIDIRSMGWVGIRDGIKAGERVVTNGAYEIKLTSASGAIPQRGHVH